ncbi:hypothetical protein FisN_15Lh332 [Fistulifera solaris]|uniref:Uncharacterized protein n=1 Tax=Fistulifera solaris TaxID=1519565 RepID=A0A1Z5JWG8_FISSO|nr:hypothetical protein FisN_15Lh332 [Fistulifera solaris]|eukprot:GAX18375.1 hypothetical protein FisN_15Lh332 [Fistulifera solaris]
MAHVAHVNMLEPSSRVFLPILPSLEQDSGKSNAGRSLFSSPHPPRVRAISLSSSNDDPNNATRSTRSDSIEFITAKDTTPSWPLLPDDSCDLVDCSSDTRPRLEMRISPRR